MGRADGVRDLLKPQPSGNGETLTHPEDAPLGTTVVFPRWQDRNHPRLIAIRWSPPWDRDEEHPWLLVGVEGRQVLADDSVEGCEILTCPLVEACADADTED